VVHERPPAVDLDDREPLAVGPLELRVAADVDLRQLERDLAPRGRDDGPRTLAEVAAGRVVDVDVRRYG
jgi:hypothetical protein